MYVCRKLLLVEGENDDDTDQLRLSVSMILGTYVVLIFLLTLVIRWERQKAKYVRNFREVHLKSFSKDGISL